MKSKSCWTLLLWSSWLIPCYAISCWRNTTCNGPLQPAFEGPWEGNNFAPSSRHISPKHVLSINGSGVRAYEGRLNLSEQTSSAVLDFGIEVGGIISFNYQTSGPASIGLAFSEATTWVGKESDFSNGGTTPDLAIFANVTSAGSYAMPDGKIRGGFRYLTVFLPANTDIQVELSNVSLEIGFQPTWSNIRAYQGYFHCSDEDLNRIWYSGAYTLQTNNVPPHTGRTVPFVENTWDNTGYLGPGDTIIVDGAKRDRAVWPGDMGIAVPSTFVSVGDLESVKNALQVIYDYQNPDGSFPEAGPPLLQQDSDTYHMWTMIGTYNYVLYSNDTEFLETNWPKYLRAMNYVYGLVGSSGLLNVTGIRDWARLQQGFNNTQANVILYHTLQTGSSLASWLGNSEDLAATFSARATTLREAINRHCYDIAYGAFKDNATATMLHPQDANSMAIMFNATSLDRAESISTKLLNNWTPIGAVTPELPNNISPFISSFEIQAHFSIGQTARALELIRRCWGWYLNHPNGTQSTVIEGYLADGTFGYRYNRGYVNPSYTSHAHGWSSGPTSALTEFVLGLRITGRAGETWTFKPQFGDLNFAEGGFMTKLGKFRAKLEKTDKGYVVDVAAPDGTTGDIELPALDGSENFKVDVDGKKCSQQEEDGNDGKINMHLGGGEHRIKVTQG